MQIKDLEIEHLENRIVNFIYALLTIIGRHHFCIVILLGMSIWDSCAPLYHQFTTNGLDLHLILQQ
jgi:hypothetical protein